jgi:3-oxoacyl-[acyl-carrier protein] reductase
VTDSLRDSTPVFPDLAGKVAVVTGGSMGIGAATCRALGVNGVSVGVAGLDEREAIDRVVHDVQQLGGEALGLCGDLTQFSAAEELKESVEREFGPVDVLLAFAGGVRDLLPLPEIDEKTWRNVVDANLTTTFLTLKAFVPDMIDRQRGAIVTMGSNTARHLDSLNTTPYAAAKAGIVMMTRHLAHEVAPYGIRVNCVCPATTRSERVDAILTPEQTARFEALAPLGRLGRPEDTAGAALFLASEAASFITGVSLDIAGGRVMM